MSHDLVLPLYLTHELFGSCSYSYEQHYQEALGELGFSEEGEPPEYLDRQTLVCSNTTDSLFLLTHHVLQSHWLLVLRQAVVHPQVGDVGRRVLGGTIKTVDEVLATYAGTALRPPATA